MQARLVKDFLINQSQNTEKGIYLIRNGSSKDFTSYARLYELALQKLGIMQRLGIEKGQEVLIDFTGFLDFFSYIWACILGDFIPMPINLKFFNEHKIGQLLEDSSRMVIITDKKLDKSRLTGIMILNKEELSSNENIQGSYQMGGNPDDTFMIQFSSGSTNNPKGVMITSHGFMVNFADIRLNRNLTDNEKVFGWTPITHNMSLFGMHINPILRNYDQYHMPTEDFVRNPILWIEICAREEITISAMANYGIMLILNAIQNYKGEWKYDLSKLKHLFCGSDVISVSHSLEFIDMLKKMNVGDNVFASSYGLSEATLIVSMGGIENTKYHYYIARRENIQLGQEIIRAEAGEDTVLISSVGEPLKHVEIKIVDEDGMTLQDSYVGIIKVKGEAIMKGYYKNPEMTEKAIDKEGWLDTGDIGFMCDGRLYITGRYKELIIYNGRNYYSTDIQAMIRDELGIKTPVCIIGFRKSDDVNDTVVGFIEGQYADDEFEQIKKKIVSHIQQRIHLVIEKLILIEKLPRTSSGKLNSFEMKKYYESINSNKSIKKEYREKEIIRNEIIRIFKEVLTRDIKADDDLSEQGLSSIEITGIQAKMVNSNINLKIVDFFECRTINDLVEKSMN